MIYIIHSFVCIGLIIAVLRCMYLSAALATAQKTIEILRKNDRGIEDIAWICEPCANMSGGFMGGGHCATWHRGKCGICGKMASVTEPRDFNLTMYKIHGQLV